MTILTIRRKMYNTNHDLKMKKTEKEEMAMISILFTRKYPDFNQPAARTPFIRLSGKGAIYFEGGTKGDKNNLHARGRPPGWRSHAGL